MRWIILAFMAAIGLFWLYVRLAPTDVAAWHVRPEAKDPGDYPGKGRFSTVRAFPTAPEEVLRAVEQAALQTPRTRLFAGSVEEGMMTYETRTRFGFPDYTTVTVIPAGEAPGSHPAPLLMIYGRLRFGVEDLGVNQARIKGWLAQLGPLVTAP